MREITRKKFTIYDLVAIGFMAALVFVSSKLSIPIATGIDNTRIHFGNIFCLLSGLLFGGLRGGLAAGIGSMIFDFTDPIYIASSPFTLVFKFTMGFLCGWTAYARQREGRKVGYNFLGAVVGQVAYMVLYLSKSFLEDIFFKQVETQTALVDVGTKALTSGANAVIAVLISVPLALALRKALSYTTIYQKVMHAKS